MCLIDVYINEAYNVKFSLTCTLNSNTVIVIQSANTNVTSMVSIIKVIYFLSFVAVMATKTIGWGDKEDSMDIANQNFALRSLIEQLFQKGDCSIAVFGSCAKDSDCCPDPLADTYNFAATCCRNGKCQQNRNGRGPCGQCNNRYCVDISPCPCRYPSN